MPSSLNTDCAALDLLEARIEQLEQQVYGETGPENVSEPYLKTLQGANTLLNAAANSHKNVQTIYKRLPELNSYLTEETLFDPTSEFERKLNLVLTLNEDYKSKTKRLEEIDQLQSSLDQQNLKSLNELKPLLAEVLDSYMTLNNKLHENDSMRNIVSSGQQLAQEVSKSLVATNTALCQLEMSRQKK